LLLPLSACGAGCRENPPAEALDALADVPCQGDLVRAPETRESVGNGADRNPSEDFAGFALDVTWPDLPEWIDLPEVTPRFVKGLGDPCLEDSQCGGDGYLECRKLGDFPPFCAPANCMPECPLGWNCVMEPDSAPDMVFYCLPDGAEPCEPCLLDADCFDIDGRCVNLGDGRHCTAACGENGTCPEDHLCEPVVGIDPQPVDQCLPTSGECGDE